MLFSKLEEYGNKTALIEADGTQISYQELVDLASTFQQQLPKRRQLIFLKVENTLSSIVAYVACVRANHPVLLLSSKNGQNSQKIIDDYQPNLVIDTSVTPTKFEVLNNETIALHDELCLLLATSGSTGSPKLVKLSQQNIFSNTQSIIEYLSITESERAITSLDLNYSYGLSIVNAHLESGASIVLTNLSSTQDQFWQLFQQHSVTSFSGVPYHFEGMLRSNVKLEHYPSLRYMTQAGGKLPADKVKSFAQACSEVGAEFFVMYGQTEASPRISYLPPKFIKTHPESIGVAVPRGELAIVNQDGDRITKQNVEGELIYKGPNVMMGYARNANELANKETIEWLKTGDLAKFTDNNLVMITGRLSRFAKPFGIRINLDDVEKFISPHLRSCAIVSLKEKIYIVSDSKVEEKQKLLSLLGDNYKIPHTQFEFYQITELPRLANGKLNYRDILKEIETARNSFRGKVKSFMTVFIDELKTNTGLKSNAWKSALTIYAHYFPAHEVTPECSFKKLSGDSLLYVSLSLELENYLGTVPENWVEMTISELELLKKATADV